MARIAGLDLGVVVGVAPVARGPIKKGIEVGIALGPRVTRIGLRASRRRVFCDGIGETPGRQQVVLAVPEHVVAVPLEVAEHLRLVWTQQVVQAAVGRARAPASR